MAAMFKSFLAILLLITLTRKGFCASHDQCPLDGINVITETTGNLIQGKTEFQVTVTNRCTCRQGIVKLSCPEFETIEPIDMNVFRRAGDICLLNNGDLIASGASISFKYAWDRPYSLLPKQALSFC